MAKAKTATPPTPSSYEVLGSRLQKVVNSPAAQKNKAAVLYPATGDSPDDWGRVMDEIAENDNVTLNPQEDGSVRISWIVPKDD